MAYFNTNVATGQTLLKFRKKADAQEERILSFFEKENDKEWSPHEVWKILYTESTPITSVRARISVMAKIGILKYTGKMVTSPYGRPERLYTIGYKTQPQ